MLSNSITWSIQDGMDFTQSKHLTVLLNVSCVGFGGNTSLLDAYANWANVVV